MMNMELFFRYSPWFIPLCLLAGILYAAILYYRERHNEFPGLARTVLAAARAILVALLAFLLLGPFVRKLSHETEKPIVVFAQDFSRSMVMTADSTFYRHDYLDQLKSILAELEDTYQVESFAFGQEVVPGLGHDYDHDYTDMGSVLAHVDNTFGNRNLAGVFLASDGLVNRGGSPRFMAGNMTYPIHAVAMGDTTVKTDLKIREVRHNKIAYKGNRFPVEVEVIAENAAEKTSTLTIHQDGERIAQKRITIPSDHYRKTFSFEMEAEETGIREYNIRIRPLEEEENVANNRQNIYIEVLKTRQRILILGRRPHPDLATIRRAIENNPNYDTELHLIDQFHGNAHAYNLVVMHGLPQADRRNAQMLQQLANNQVPVWFIAGPEVDVNLLNRYSGDLNFTTNRFTPQEVAGVLNQNFALFNLEKDPEGLLPSLPPLTSLYGRLSAPDPAGILAYKRIGSVNTSQPLWAFAQDGRSKYAILMGEGIWKWRVFNYMRKDNHQFLDELVRKTIKFLVVSDDKGQFRVSGSTRFGQHQPVRFRAELYNQSFELINEPEVDFLITNQEGEEFPHVMTRSREVYSLNIRRMPPGMYQYRATTSLGGRDFENTGRFVVEEVNLESMNTTADHRLLHQLANDNNGTVIMPRQLEKIPEILGKKDIKPMTYTVMETMEWIHLRWIFFLLLGLLTMEWIIRKAYGAL